MAFDLIPYGMAALFIAVAFHIYLTRRAFSELTDEEKLRFVKAWESKGGGWGLIMAVLAILFWIFIPGLVPRDYVEWLILGECILLVLAMFIFQTVGYRRLVRLDISEAYRRAFLKGSWILVAGSLVQAATLFLATRMPPP